MIYVFFSCLPDISVNTYFKLQLVHFFVHSAIFYPGAKQKYCKAFIFDNLVYGFLKKKKNWVGGGKKKERPSIFFFNLQNN